MSDRWRCSWVISLWPQVLIGFACIALQAILYDNAISPFITSLVVGWQVGLTTGILLASLNSFLNLVEAVSPTTLFQAVIREAVLQYRSMFRYFGVYFVVCTWRYGQVGWWDACTSRTTLGWILSHELFARVGPAKVALIFLASIFLAHYLGESYQVDIGASRGQPSATDPRGSSVPVDTTQETNLLDLLKYSDVLGTGLWVVSKEVQPQGQDNMGRALGRVVNDSTLHVTVSVHAGQKFQSFVANIAYQGTPGGILKLVFVINTQERRRYTYLMEQIAEQLRAAGEIPLPQSQEPFMAARELEELAAATQAHPMLAQFWNFTNICLGLVPYPVMDLSTTKEEIGNLTSEATIATFLAAVQAQIVAISYQDNSAGVKVATNVLGFAGMLLDVSAACFAMLASTLLQRHMTLIERELNVIENASLQELMEAIRVLHANPRRLVSVEIQRRIVATAIKHLRDFAKALTENADANVPSQKLGKSPKLNIGSLTTSFAKVQNVTFIGDVSGNTLLLGILSFLASVQCLAISTQPRAVWIITAVICFAVVALYPISQFSGRIRDSGIEEIRMLACEEQENVEGSASPDKKSENDRRKIQEARKRETDQEHEREGRPVVINLRPRHFSFRGTFVEPWECRLLSIGEPGADRAEKNDQVEEGDGQVEMAGIMKITSAVKDINRG
ncbi:hypothetical protein C8R43DRAFT_1176794 [Mycena crocata]|nr:hypothetical protein C8R43DRAFT_1176794 [Mycena crocata]